MAEQPTESSVEADIRKRACQDLYDRFKQVTRSFISDQHITHSHSVENHKVGIIDFIFPLNDHLAFLKSVSTDTQLGSKFLALDGSRTWLLYWTLHGSDLLGKLSDYLCDSVSDKLPNNHDRFVAFLQKCQDPKSGGLGGSPGQIAHSASTYAGVAALLCIGTEQSCNAIDRESIRKYLISLRIPGKGFKLQEDGETDMRGTYCTIATASMLGFLNETPELTDGLGEYISSCQTYEGGLGGDAGYEAHAGYTYCGLAAAFLIGEAHKKLDLYAMLEWLIHRQQPNEGGMNGRPNKAADSCYSFWAVACLPILKACLWLKGEKSSIPGPDSCWISPISVQAFVLLCCQPGVAAWDNGKITESAERGGFCDKPGSTPDFYHTCYALSGLSLIQVNICLTNNPTVTNNPNVTIAFVSNFPLASCPAASPRENPPNIANIIIPQDWCSKPTTNILEAGYMCEDEYVPVPESMKLMLSALPKLSEINPLFNLSEVAVTHSETIFNFTQDNIAPGVLTFRKFKEFEKSLAP